MADPQDIAEALDDDKLDDDPSRDGIESPGEYPPDRPSGVDRAALTPALEAMGESVEDRDDRTTPDPLAVELDRAAALDDRDAAPGAAVEVAGLDGLDELGEDPVDVLLGDDGRPLGRIVDPTAGAERSEDDEADLVGEVDPEVEAFDDPDLSAEEAAMHLTREPDYDAEDSYLEDR